MAYLERSRGKVLREHGVDEATIEQIRIDDRADFNSNRRFYHWTSDFGEYLEGMADREQSAEVKTVEDLLDEIEDENLYQALLTVDRRTLQIVLLKMKGYSTKEIAPLVHLTTGAIYARLDHLRKSCGRFYSHLIQHAFLWAIGWGIKFSHPILE